MSVAVVGTGTEVGKTIVSAVVLARYGSRMPLAYWKPVATGAPDDRDVRTVRRLAGNAATILDEAYLYEPPVSPHLAARWARRPISVPKLLRSFDEHRSATPRRGLVVEGVGGLLVPLAADGTLLVDVLAAMGLPCLLVASSRVGTINHTLLSIEAMRTRKVELVGVVLNGPRDAVSQDNRRVITRLGNVRVVGEVEPIRPLGRSGVVRAAEAFDRRGALRRYLEPC